MKPAWDQLMAEFADHKSVLIADVDCTAGGKDLCEQVGVQGYPTIKYGDPNSLEDYNGGRDFDALKAFSNENLGPRCGPANPDLCDAEAKKSLDKFMKMPMVDLNKAIDEQDAAMAKADKDLDELLKKLQAQYEEGTKARDATKKAIKEGGLGMMKSVKAHRKSEKAEL